MEYAVILCVLIYLNRGVVACGSKMKSCGNTCQNGGAVNSVLFAKERSTDKAVIFGELTLGIASDTLEGVDEELVFEYTYNETANEDGVTIAYYLKMFDELILDYSYGICENENGITFTYDITKLLLSMPLENPDSDWIIDSSEYIEGSGAFTLTFTPAE